MIKSLLNEYGINWTINRSLYVLKLKALKKSRFIENIFEKKIDVIRINIFNFDLKLIGNFLDKLSEEKRENIIATADKAIDGRILGFSSIELDYGNPINWHLNPLSNNQHNANDKWFNIPDFDENVGDIKVIWEASRLTHFLFFARAYLISRDTKYYVAFIEQLKSWLENNPYSYGSNYKCGQEATLRMVNVLIAYSVFKKNGLVLEDDENYIVKLVEGSYKKVLSNFFYAHKCIKNNHTFTEILGLIIGAWCCGDEKSLRSSYKLMDNEIKTQFFIDGGFSQYSFNYHRFTLQIFECLYKISETTGIRIVESERIKKSVLLLYQVQEDNGDVPNYGSNDGALIFPLSSCSYRDFRPVLNTMYALLENKRLYEFGDYDEELLWFGKKVELPKESIIRQSCEFNESGYYVFRHNEGFLMTCLQNYNSRPAHMDQLHIDVWHRGINIICDNGTYSYASDLGRDLSLTSGHNTVKVSEYEQMNKKGAFLVTDWAKRKHVEYSDTYFLGSMTSQNGYNHQRKIIKTQQGYLIEDEVLAEVKKCEFNFHTPCQVQVIPEGFLLLLNNSKVAIVKTKGNIEIKETYRSKYYLRKEKINKIVVEHKFEKGFCKATFELLLM